MNAPADVVLQVARIPQHTTSLPIYVAGWYSYYYHPRPSISPINLLKRFVSVMFSVMDDDTVDNNP